MRAAEFSSRREFLVRSLAVAATTVIPGLALPAPKPAEQITTSDLAAYERLADVKLTPAQRDAILSDVRDAVAGIQRQHAQKLNPFTLPSAPFRPLRRPRKEYARVQRLGNNALPDTVMDLALRLRAGKATSEQLVRECIERCETKGRELRAIVSIFAESAVAAAKESDARRKAGKDLGPLDGIPYGLKDIFATAEGTTTWGAAPYANQKFDQDATVVKRLREAGAILVAKTSVGSLAMGDVWHGGKTLNPWNRERGSSGSSAGSCSGVAAGLFPFAIGSETLGSVASPSWECRVVGHRPTFGRISRAGAMSLSSSMDKVGIIARSPQDCALVFQAIHGADEADNASVTVPFLPNAVADFRDVRVGFVSVGRANARQRGVRARLVTAGAIVREFAPPVVDDFFYNILSVEAAGFHDELTRSGRIDEVQDSAWPGIFRAARFVSGVDYFNATRLRAELMARFEKQLDSIDVLITPDIGLRTLGLTNLTGHPQVIVPDYPTEQNTSRSWSLIGHLDDDDRLLAWATALQNLIGVRAQIAP